MNKRIMLHIVCGLIGALVYYMLFEETTPLQAIWFCFLYVGISVVFDVVLGRIRLRNKKGENLITTADHEQVKALIEAIGGTANIVSTDFESARVKVVIKDVDLLDQEELKSLSLEGAYLSGNQLQVTVGKSSSDFSRQIQDSIQ
ncbi:MAG: hypothetical protein FWG67_07325 [Defluviitaleaceae bacterium]|nr:hypothetical protein [Defluviitaleaceae bacterium]